MKTRVGRSSTLDRSTSSSTWPGAPRLPHTTSTYVTHSTSLRLTGGHGSCVMEHLRCSALASSLRSSRSRPITSPTLSLGVAKIADSGATSASPSGPAASPRREGRTTFNEVSLDSSVLYGKQGRVGDRGAWLSSPSASICVMARAST